MRRLINSTAIITITMLVSAATPARADNYFNPWAGVNFGSASTESASNGRGAFGASAGVMNAGAFGGEVTFGYSPSFFGTNNDFGSNTVLDLSGNLILGIPLGGQTGGGFRPYVTAGLGLIRTQIDGGTVFDVSASDNSLGWNLGAGFMGYFNDHVGLRGDVRYLRNFGDHMFDDLNFDLGNLHFWRGSLGLVIR